MSRTVTLCGSRLSGKVVLGGRVFENQYFTDPAEFLHKVALRRPVESPLRAN